MNFIQQTMATLQNYNEQLKHCLNKVVVSKQRPDGCVVNLSKHPFSKDTYKLLTKNLSFIPTLGIYSKSKLNDELQNFYCLIKLKAYFKETETTTKKDENTIFIPEKQKPWTPSQNHHSIETFIDLVQHGINDAKILHTKRPKDNLTKGEQKTLEELSKRDDIIITNANKGGAIVVIMDIDKYISEPQRQLDDENNYKKL